MRVLGCRFPGSMHGNFERSPLHVAAWETHQSVLSSPAQVQDLSFSPKISSVDDDAENQAVEVLLHLGADLHAGDSNNATALHLAAAKGHIGTVQVGCRLWLVGCLVLLCWVT
jgi:hypothetical protein